jgi:predicted Rossmann fold flavoprotein
MGTIVVVGGGAAGMMAAITAAGNNKVILVERNDRLGKKLFITGKGRCNLTNACDIDRLFNAITTNPKFMYSSIYTFDNEAVIDFFNKAGLVTKVERGDRVFPASDHSSDVIGVLKTLINRNRNIEVMLNTRVQDIVVKDGCVTGVKTGIGEIKCDAVILATGGKSYPLTGSTGDGYNMAEKFGHTIKDIMPSLVPYNIKETFCKELMGLSLKNVSFCIRSGKKTVFNEQGEMLFTHFGISGPLVIKSSAYIHRYLDKELSMYIDLKPALDREALDQRIVRDFKKNINKEFKNSLGELLPVKLIPVIIEMTAIDPYKQVNSVTREERERLVDTIKHMELTFDGLRGLDEAIITKGGINTKEINPATMESKLVRRLYFAGEIIDVDALTGGFNLQVAWSTGRLAGMCAAEE